MTAHHRTRATREPRRMNPLLSSLLAFAAAALTPAILFLAAGALAYTWRSPYAWLVVVVAAAHVLVLGILAAVVLARFKAMTWWSCPAMAFLLGCLPVGILTWPLRHSAGFSASHWQGGRMVDTVVDGVPTLAGWLNWLAGMGLMGALGASGGLAFWFAWRCGMRAKGPASASVQPPAP
jgi:hypothetical protein